MRFSNSFQRVAYEFPLATADAPYQARYFGSVKNGRYRVGLTINKSIDGLRGRPVWLGSVSRWRRGRMIYTSKWDRKALTAAESVLLWLLDGVGDLSAERLFRMNLTLCLHRALSHGEADGLPDWWKQRPGVHVEGGPLEVLRSRGVARTPSLEPCAAPETQIISPGSPVRLAVDCGRCESCQARARLEAQFGSVT